MTVRKLRVLGKKQHRLDISHIIMLHEFLAAKSGCADFYKSQLDIHQSGPDTGMRGNYFYTVEDFKRFKGRQDTSPASVTHVPEGKPGQMM